MNSAPPPRSIEALFAKIHAACLPGVWSKGVALARDPALVFDPTRTGTSGEPGTEDAIVARIPRSDRPVAARVSLWPPAPGAEGDEEEGDWYCDCGDRGDVCAHSAAAIIALKARAAATAETGAGGAASDAAAPDAEAGHAASGAATPAGLARPSAVPSARGQLLYCFARGEGNRLRFERRLRFSEREERLAGTLVAYVGGRSSGRITSPPLTVTREDFAVDAILSEAADDERGLPSSATLVRLLPALADSAGVRLDGLPIRTSPRRVRARIRVAESDGGGFRVSRAERPGENQREWFANGAWLVGDVLSAAEGVAFTPEERRLLAAEGETFRSREEIARLVTELLPRLMPKVELELATERLPRAVEANPRAELVFENREDGSLMIYPHVVYGDPPLAEFGPDGFALLSASELPVRNLSGEAELARRLQTELHLRAGQWSRFEGTAALEFATRARGWDAVPAGASAGAHGAGGALVPRLELRMDGGFDLRFEGVSRAEADRVLAAWNAELAERVRALLEARARAPDRRLPRAFLPEAADLGDALGARVPESLRALRDGLRAGITPSANAGTRANAIPAAALPDDLRADLRPYQRVGVNWLCFLRDAGLGAMLADDMGLGKTLQALCAIRGRTLVVCPTSVLHAWRDQVARFRPALRYALYYGAGRALDAEADITLTSYAVLRLDRDKLGAAAWDTVILDEAQTIRNADSQTASAAHALARAPFRLTLSGTPVENRPDDLWSQFEFLNPGLLGARPDFVDEAGASSGLERLRRRVHPFILRRLKRDVAPELPPRTEVVLECELSAPERAVYDAVLAASRSEALAKLESESGGRGVFAALEALLRLRQACCDSALVPGAAQGAAASPGAGPSSKIALLLERLTETTAEGHRSLVFSQWTSLLDRIEPALRAAGIAYLRLDGATSHRDEVVAKFQSDSGPPVLLISLKAGGVGLTLTRADHIYLMDPWWNPAAEDQAADRAHRIGQQNPVLIHRLIAAETVEERILALQSRKREIAAGLLSGGGPAIDSITREDLIALLE